MELQRSSGTEDEVKVKGLKMDLYKVKDRETIEKKTKKKKKKKKKNGKFVAVGKFGCFRSDYGHPTIEKSDDEGNIDMESACTDINHAPTHLVIMVNGIIGSAQNWRFAAKQFLKKYPEDLIVHCSECNYSMLTFDGVDVMGSRLADEVISVTNRHPNLQKISFIGHSLGGVVARYAIAKLYSQELIRKDCHENGGHVYEESNDSFPGHKLKGKIAGLEPVNFITVATPHLGSRGHRQVPLFCGVYTLEKLASHMSWFLGRTGKHLFLTDSDDGQPPLLLQMVSDHEDLKFLSALHSFKRRAVYANVHFDHLVGWSTSSIRRRNELPKRQYLSKNGTYPHVLKVETSKVADFPQEGAAEAQVNGHKIDDLEETMIRALTKLSWERIDVSFKGSRQRYFAHNTIQVKGSWMNSDGADVVQHMVDNFQL